MKIYIKKILLVLFIISIIIVRNDYLFATNSDSIISSNSDISNSAFSQEMDNESLNRFIAEYRKSIDDAMNEASLPDIVNMPTPFSQSTFHPYNDDYFGINKDTTPIFSVNLDGAPDEKKNYIGISFDSAYVNKYTYELLDILDEYDIKATFFMTYEFMSNNPTQIQDIINRGHEIGNHSTTHPDFNELTDQKVVYEVWRTHSFLRNLCGVEMSLFRFPFGSYSPRTVSILKNLGYYPIQWALDSVDWKNQGKEALIERFDGNPLLKPGSIILFHNGATYTPEALPDIIKMVENKNCKFVRISDLIHRHNFYMKNGVQFLNLNGQ